MYIAIGVVDSEYWTLALQGSYQSKECTAGIQLYAIQTEGFYAWQIRGCYERDLQ